MADRISFSITNDLAEIPRLNDVVAVFLSRVWMPARAAGIVDLAVEELVTDFIKHSGDDDNAYQIQVSLCANEDYLVVVIEDEGRPFDPLQAPEHDASFEERRDGKSGLDLIRSIAESIDYHRLGGKNRLEIQIDMDVH